MNHAFERYGAFQYQKILYADDDHHCRGWPPLPSDLSASIFVESTIRVAIDHVIASESVNTFCGGHAYPGSFFDATYSLNHEHPFVAFLPDHALPKFDPRTSVRRQAPPLLASPFARAFAFLASPDQRPVRFRMNHVRPMLFSSFHSSDPVLLPPVELRVHQWRLLPPRSTIELDTH